MNRGLLAGLLGMSVGACFGTDGGISECGNAIVENEEVCDDGVNDGSYGGCEYDCLAPGPYCGDGEIRGTDELYRSCGSCWARSYRVSFECDEDFCDCYAVPMARPTPMIIHPASESHSLSDPESLEDDSSR